MMVIMQPGASRQQVEEVIAAIEARGLSAHVIEGVGQSVIGAVGETHAIPTDVLAVLEGVENVTRISQPYKLASRTFHPSDSVFPLDGFTIGGREIPIIAGPCSVESRDQLLDTARAIREAGANALRGGAYKPRTSPYAFQGLGEEGLAIMAEARELTGMPVVAEVMSIAQVEVAVKYVDVLQVGARNMQNFPLLRAVGETRTPVLLKRGISASIEELLMASEYILAGGNPRVMLCERGIRTFETATRNTTDINAIPVLKSLSHLPVLLDPSHATGHWEYVGAVARAAVAAGADGLLIEVHNDPAHALSDGPQSLTPQRFAALVGQLRAVAEAVGRQLAPLPVPVAAVAWDGHA
ncbi:MAG: 3-deoxy-7-phosphoheptulonate synthase [Anaerolineales bacterium]|nr:3-deoxy-7-phosphoheptulonate synthase [Anaerolineales bacterium]